MSKELALLITVAAGGVVAAQAPANNVISQRLGGLGAVTVNFVAGYHLGEAPRYSPARSRDGVDSAGLVVERRARPQHVSHRRRPFTAME